MNFFFLTIALISCFAAFTSAGTNNGTVSSASNCGGNCPGKELVLRSIVIQTGLDGHQQVDVSHVLVERQLRI